MELPYYVHKYNKLDGCYANLGLFIVVRFSDLRVMKILAQALVLALLIMVLPVFAESLPISTDYKNVESISPNGALNVNSLPLLIDDLANQGLLTSKGKFSLILSKHNLNDKNNELMTSIVVSPSDIEQQSSVSDNAFDFTFTDCFEGGTARGFLDKALKVDGIMVVQLSRDRAALPMSDVPSNFKMVYTRRGPDHTFIGMRKIGEGAVSVSPKLGTQRKLLEFLSEEKKAVLKNLEDVLLEPPRSATGKSRTYLRKTKFLPDLQNDSLEGYSRRVYIDVGGGHGSTRWFEQNYPTRNKDFDMYRIETVPQTEVESSGSDDAWEGPPTQMGISDWLWRNVKEEEYVVMKAEAEVVEEMVKSKAIVLVDELFLECKPWDRGGTSKRAYWECLALYGRLRDFGIAVHQWWG